MSREEAIESLRGILTEAVEFENSVCYVTEEDREPLEMAIKALEQEPFMNKTCVAQLVCHEDKVKVLDKIKDEIEEKYGGYDICEWFEDYDYEENDISEYRSVGDVSDILEIIDKHKAEFEPHEGNGKE